LRLRRGGLPSNLVADFDVTAVEHFRVHAASPIVPERRAESLTRLVHPFTRARLTADPKPARADPQDEATRVPEIDARDQQVRTARHRVQTRPQQILDGLPAFARDEGNLSGAALVCASDQAPTGPKLSGVERVHRATMTSLRPDPFETSARCVHACRGDPVSRVDLYFLV
jgi:hypothetical protein